ncbi:MAG: hypothetical protein D6781_02375, partial [Verrucomicrobia bacterium]
PTMAATRTKKPILPNALFTSADRFHTATRVSPDKNQRHPERRRRPGEDDFSKDPGNHPL